MNLKSNQKGFTIVELLIVIVVIAILAAISIVAYVGIQNNARASERQSDASNIARVAEVYFTNESAYPSEEGHFSNATNANLPANVAVTVQTNIPEITNANGPTKPAGSDTKTYIVRDCTTGGEVYYFDPRNSGTRESVAYGAGC